MLIIENLSKSFGQKQVLKDVNLKVQPGEILMVTGESGVGKTTLIRCLCGLENYDKGNIKYISNGNKAGENFIVLVFYNFVFFNYFTLYKNITYTLIDTLMNRIN